MTQVQINQNQKTALEMLVKGMLSTNKSITSLEFKNEVHRLGLNKAFGIAEFTQQMASNFLKDFYANNHTEMEKSIVSKDGYVYFKYTMKPQKQSLFNINAGKIVCYNANNPKEFIQDNIRRFARTECRKRFNIKDNDVRTISAKNFHKKYILGK